MQGILPRSQRTGRLSSCVLEDEVEGHREHLGSHAHQNSIQPIGEERIQAARYSRDSNIQALLLSLYKNIFHMFINII